MRGSNRRLERMRKEKAIMRGFPNRGEERRRDKMMEDWKDTMMMTRYEFIIEEIRGEHVIKKVSCPRVANEFIHVLLEIKSGCLLYVVIVCFFFGCCCCCCWGF